MSVDICARSTAGGRCLLKPGISLQTSSKLMTYECRLMQLVHTRTGQSFFQRGILAIRGGHRPRAPRR
eukprot:4780272-Pyramimonas_sp.AAC.1